MLILTTSPTPGSSWISSMYKISDGTWVQLHCNHSSTYPVAPVLPLMPYLWSSCDRTWVMYCNTCSNGCSIVAVRMMTLARHSHFVYPSWQSWSHFIALTIAYASSRLGRGPNMSTQLACNCGEMKGQIPPSDLILIAVDDPTKVIGINDLKGPRI